MNFFFNNNIKNKQSTILFIVLQILHDCDRRFKNFVAKLNEIAIQIRQKRCINSVKSFKSITIVIRFKMYDVN